MVMTSLNQKGALNYLLIPLILSCILMIVFIGTTVKFYSDFTDQRDNNQPKIEAAVEEATSEQKKELEADFEQREKEPFKVITGPSEYGSVKLVFPKTWSSYVTSSGSTEYDFYAHPNFVPAEGVNYALRASVIRRQFSDEVGSYDSQVRKGELKASSIQIAGTTGTRLDGFLEKDIEGSMVMFPVRDKTLLVWTESKDFRSDFNKVVNNLTFVP